MGLAVVIVYVIMALIAPWESTPELRNLHIMFWLIGAGILSTAVRIAIYHVPLDMPQFLLMPLFIGFVMFSIVLQGWAGGAWYVLTQLLPLLVLFFVVSVSVTSLGRMQFFSAALVLTAVYIVIRCILAYYLGISAPLYTLNQAEAGYGLVRIRGLDFLSDPNDFGQFLLACIPLAAMLRKRGSAVWNVGLVYVPIAFLLFGIYLSGSRGTLLGFLALAYLAVHRFSKPLAPLVALASGAAALALGFGSGRSVSLGGGSTAGQRLGIWSDLLQSVKQHPFRGLGYGHVYDVTSLTAHNSYLLCLAEIGLAGFLCWMALLFVHGRQLREVMRRQDLSPEIRRAAGYFFATYASLLVTSFTLSRTYAFTIYIFLAQITGFVIMAKGATREKPLLTFTKNWLLASAAASIGVVFAIYAMVRLHWNL